MTTAEAIASTEPLEDRLIASATATLEMYSIHLGRALGLYRVLPEAPRTPAQLAEAAGIHPRYAREWLEQQAVAGFLTVDDAAAGQEVRVYRLDDQRAAVFTGAEVPATSLLWPTSWWASARRWTG